MVGDVNFPRTRLLCDGCPPLGWVGWISNTRTRLNENFGTPRCHVFKYKDWIGLEGSHDQSSPGDLKNCMCTCPSSPSTCYRGRIYFLTIFSARVIN